MFAGRFITIHTNPDSDLVMEKTMLENNQTAPDFTSFNRDDEIITLSQFSGKQNVVLYFYPKDDTPRCTINRGRYPIS